MLDLWKSPDPPNSMQPGGAARELTRMPLLERLASIPEIERTATQNAMFRVLLAERDRLAAEAAERAASVVPVQVPAVSVQRVEPIQPESSIASAWRLTL